MEEDPWEILLPAARIGREEYQTYPPIITWQPKNGDRPVQAAITGFTGHLRADLAAAFDHMQQAEGPPQWFAITLDSYAREGNPDDRGTDLPWEGPGSLEEAFLQGDMTVVEQMVIILRWPDSPYVEVVRQVYRHTPVDGWEWDDPQYVVDPDDDIVSAVRFYG